ncbi:hypothetical protein LOZ53_004205 [Ophidiomyces ophidiicola]|nr:hypothetical protein LOZ55_005853 [Ophidiomyces ophidiicola]KAI1984033.1 hypothetical protein LOZ54_004684 [Ophidiomyces ophidiicola]KAI1984144.1 hypothetical protein LOZ51_006722 [Ophidiomyces ophidiicola]KAI1987687.1 hypothetical protein LOZ53_004205 [Ophidiomyces ophidiicola]
MDRNPLRCDVGLAPAIPLLNPQVWPSKGTSESLQHEHKGTHLSEIHPQESTPDIGIEKISFGSTPPEAVLKLRQYAAQDLMMCRAIVVTLELTRMSKARTGIRNWMLFWKEIYRPFLAEQIIAVVSAASLEIDRLFKASAQRLCLLACSIGQRMIDLRTSQEATSIWRQMEHQITRYRKLRQRSAQIVFDKLRCRLERIPVDISDDLFDDLKRGIFALDPSGNYHPGDPIAEAWDRRVDCMAHAEAYVRQQPDLPSRPGFNDGFRLAMNVASAGADDPHTAYGNTQSLSDY